MSRLGASPPTMHSRSIIAPRVTATVRQVIGERLQAWLREKIKQIHTEQSRAHNRSGGR